MSDSWSAYKKIAEKLGFQHHMVNHQLTFVSPVHLCHTQNIESAWSSIKSSMRSLRGVTRGTLLSHLSLYEFYMNYTDRTDTGKFIAILDALKRLRV